MACIVQAVLIVGALYLAATPNHNATNYSDSPPIHGEASFSLVSEPASDAKGNRPDKESPHWYTTVQWSNWALVLIGGLTFWAIWIQSRETARSTIAMEKSVKLQEVAMRPWIVFDNWECRGGHILANATEGTFTLCFDLYNPTKLKLTLKRIRANALQQVRDVVLNQVLAPEDDPYTFEFALALRGEDLRRFRKQELVVVIQGYVEFEDVFGKKQPPQSFGYMCLCTPTGLRDLRVFEAPAPAQEEQNQDERPN
jgi:hypothetical protein